MQQMGAQADQGAFQVGLCGYAEACADHGSCLGHHLPVPACAPRNVIILIIIISASPLSLARSADSIEVGPLRVR